MVDEFVAWTAVAVEAAAVVVVVGVVDVVGVDVVGVVWSAPPSVCSPSHFTTPSVKGRSNKNRIE